MNDEIRDITIIGAGPVGMVTAFWAGMREASSQIVESLPELGGQLTTLYPEKWIFDVPGFPRIIAKDFVEEIRKQSLEQFDVPVSLETTADRVEYEDIDGERILRLVTDKGDFLSRTIIIAGGHGAFEPKKLPGYDMTPWEGKGAYYLVGEKSEFAGKDVVIIGGGDSACDWVLNLLDTASSITLVHRREGFRAHEVTVKEIMEAAEAGQGRPEDAVPGRRDVGQRQRPDREAHDLPLGGRGGRPRARRATRCCCSSASRPRSDR